MIGARGAGPHDADRLGSLRRDARNNAPDHRIALAIATETVTLVGTIGDLAVGYAIVRRLADVAEVSEIFTESGARRVGVGDAMLVEATAVGRRWGCVEIRCVAFPGDRDTKNFFEQHGMVTRLLTVSRPITP